MSYPKIPDSDLHEKVNDTFFRPPQTPAKSREESAKSGSGGEKIKKEKGSRTEKPSSKSEDTKSAQSTKPKKKKVQRRPLMTYFSEENYDIFEEMYIEIKRRVRQDTGKKLAETHVTEIAVMLTVEEYHRDPEKFIERFKERIES